MKKIYIVVALVVVVLGGFVLFQFAQPEVTQELVEYSDAEANTFVVQYNSTGETAILELDGELYELKRSETTLADTVVYRDDSANISLIETSGEAQLQIDGAVVFEDATPTRRRVEVLKSNKQGDPNANKYDFADAPCDNIDQDCTGGDDVTVTDIACGPGTVLEDDICVPEALDDDDDGDSVPTEDASVANNGGTIVIEPGATLTAAESLTFLTDNAWFWSETIYANDTSVTPGDNSQFEATFSTDGTFSSITDCNTIMGPYSVEENWLMLGPLAATKIYCEGSQDAVYGEMLAEVVSYMITEEGNLVLMLRYDSGSMIFTPVETGGTRATDYNSSRSNKSY